MDIDADKIAACAQPIAEMARALGAAHPELAFRYHKVATSIASRAKEGHGYHFHRNGVGGGDGGLGADVYNELHQLDEDLESIVAACAGLADLHPSDWMRMKAIDRRIAARPDESGTLIHQLFATGAAQVVIERTDKPGEFRVVVPTRRAGCHESRADGLDEALRRAHNAIDVAR